MINTETLGALFSIATFSAFRVLRSEISTGKQILQISSGHQGTKAETFKIREMKHIVRDVFYYYIFSANTLEEVIGIFFLFI